MAADPILSRGCCAEGGRTPPLHGTRGAVSGSGNPTAGPGLGGLSQLLASTCKVIRKLFEAPSPKIRGTGIPQAIARCEVLPCTAGPLVCVSPCGVSSFFFLFFFSGGTTALLITSCIWGTGLPEPGGEPKAQRLCEGVSG